MPVAQPFRSPDAVARPRRWAATLLLLLWCVVVAVACGEIALRNASRFGVLLFDVEMWKYARELKTLVLHPSMMLEHRPNREAMLMGVRVRTDERGFRRGSPALEAARTGRERVVVVLGDSCALGWGVPEQATLSTQLEERLNRGRPPEARIVVVNAGVGNSNTAMEYGRYLRDVRPLRPAWVILGYFINDAEPDPPPYEQPLVQASVVYGMLSTRLPLLLSLRPHDYRTYYQRLYEPDAPGIEAFRGALRGLGAALREDGVPGTLLIIQEMHSPRDPAFSSIYGSVSALALESGFLEVVDPAPDFPPGPGHAMWVTPGDSHPDGTAQGLMAEALMRSRGAALLDIQPAPR